MLVLKRPKEIPKTIQTFNFEIHLDRKEKSLNRNNIKKIHRKCIEKKFEKDKTVWFLISTMVSSL